MNRGTDADDVKLESRLMVVSTRHNRGKTPGAKADIEIDLRNVATNIKDATLGMTIETVTFHNYLYNVPDKLSRCIVQPVNSNLGLNPNDPWELKIEPNQYDILAFAPAIQEAFNKHYGGGTVLTMTVVETVGQETLPLLLEFELDGSFGPPGSYFTIQWVRDSLAYPIGVERESELKVTVGPDPTYTLTNLAGESVVYLHSEALTASRHSIGGHGVPDSVLCSLPINVPFGAIQTTRVDQHKPMIVWDRQSPQNIDTIDLSIRDGDRDVIDLIGSGEMTAVIRLWLKNI